MKHVPTFQEFVDNLNKLENDKKIAQEISRSKELMGLEQSEIFKELYAIQITIEAPAELLFEHDQYKQFKKTTNRYTHHPENPSIPVKAHYHIVPSNSKKELYAVNVEDGMAHHRANRGHVVPKKEADELRTLGVNIPLNNILESREFTMNENNSNNTYTFFINISGS